MGLRCFQKIFLSQWIGYLKRNSIRNRMYRRGILSQVTVLILLFYLKPHKSIFYNINILCVKNKYSILNGLGILKLK